MTEQITITTDQALVSGFVAILGRPNVGKSTLINALLGQKLSITSKKAHTTRCNVLGVLNTEAMQAVFLDTPGMSHSSDVLARALNRSVHQAIAQCDVAIVVLEMGRLESEDRKVIGLLPKQLRVIVVLNKFDVYNDPHLVLPFIAKIKDEVTFAEIIPLSAKTGLQLDVLLTTLANFLPRKGLIYEKDVLTVQGERFFATEFIREKLFRYLGDELPYHLGVEIEKYHTRADGLRQISALIVSDQKRHKQMIIGKHGAKLKIVSSAARIDLERFLAAKVFLSVWVKIQPNWRNKKSMIDATGQIF